MVSSSDKFAVIADIHGNSDALRAVLRDMERHGVTEAVNLGDHFSGPLDAAGTAEALTQCGFLSIRGNHDRWLIEQDPDDMGPSDRVAYDQLNQEQLDWLRTLPPTRVLSDEIFMCHGTPKSDTTYWLEHVKDDAFIGMASPKWIEAHASDIQHSLILCAHTHTARSVRLADGRMVLNPGSVGCPGYNDDIPRHHVMQTGTPAASYAIVERCEHGWSPTFRQVPYDTAAMVGLAQQRGRAEWASAFATGWVGP